MSAPDYFTPEELAARWRIKPKSVLRLARELPMLPCIKLGRGKNAPVRFPVAAIERWEAANTQGRGTARMRAPLPGDRNSAQQRAEAAS